MTPQEQIAYLRHAVSRRAYQYAPDPSAVEAVCDLAERALLTDEEAEAVRDDLVNGALLPITRDVLRRLLPDGGGEHRLTDEKITEIRDFYAEDRSGSTAAANIVLLCDALLAERAAHAGIGGTE